MTIHCSACGAQVGLGNSFCQGCGLRLTAQAVAVPKQRISLVAWAVLIVGLFIVFCDALDSYQQQKQAAAESAVLAAMHSGKLSTPEAFQRQCGNASTVQLSSGGATLTYPTHALTDLIVDLPARGGPPVFHAESAVFDDDSGQFESFTNPVGDDFALSVLRCTR